MRDEAQLCNKKSACALKNWVTIITNNKLRPTLGAQTPIFKDSNSLEWWGRVSKIRLRLHCQLAVRLNHVGVPVDLGVLTSVICQEKAVLCQLCHSIHVLLPCVSIFTADRQKKSVLWIDSINLSDVISRAHCKTCQCVKIKALKHWFFWCKLILMWVIRSDQFIKFCDRSLKILYAFSRGSLTGSEINLTFAKWKMRQNYCLESKSGTVIHHTGG